MIKKLLKGAATAVALGAFALVSLPAQADVIDDIKERGVLKVAVKADYKPYGFRDTSGDIIGIEPALAKDVADKLGVDIEFVPVVSSNRMQFLQQGKVDLLIASMTDKPDRRKVVWIVEPNYYSSGTNIMAPKSFGFKEWEELRGKPVCGIQGAFYNKKTGREFGATIVAFKGTAEVYAALKAGNCPSACAAGTGGSPQRRRPDRRSDKWTTPRRARAGTPGQTRNSNPRRATDRTSSMRSRRTRRPAAAA